MTLCSSLSRCFGTALIALSAATVTTTATAQTDTVLRIVPQADLKILDPIWTTAFVTRDHGYMIYDTLFAIDGQGQVQPQMVDTYSASPDAKTWTFQLRDGLAFHDGQPVTSADVIASLQRWGQRDGLGQRMFAALDTLEPIDEQSFRMSFNQPFGMVLDALAKPSGSPAFIMPERVANTPADQQIDEYVGSGPYVFAQDEFRAGERVTYLKNTDYVPRSEEPSGLAGGKNVYVDRVEWVILKDAQTQMSAITNGEVDMLSWMPNEHYETLSANPDLEVVAATGPGAYFLHLNHHIPPFDNPDIAKAALMAINQQALLRAQLVFSDLYDNCTSIYPCDSPLASDQTSYFTGKPQFEEAKKLLKEAGYDGTPVVLMQPADFGLLNKLPPVMAQLLREAGFNVDMQAMDWPTLLMRRAQKDPVANGGWNLFMTGWGNSDNMNPMYFAPLTGTGEKGWFGWAVNDELERLKSEFVATTDPEERKQLAEQIQIEVYDSGLLAPLGELRPHSVIRKDVVSGVVQAPVNVFWNLRNNSQ